MEVLLVGAGVVGTVYGAQLADTGNRVSVLRHGARADEVADIGLVAIDRTELDRTVRARVTVVDDVRDGSFDLVVVAVWATDQAVVSDILGCLPGEPVVLRLGNTLDPSGSVSDPRSSHWGFPGIGGSLRDGVVEYARIPQQPTTLASGGGSQIAEFEAAITARGFQVARTDDIAGWLAYHSVFIASVASALQHCDGSAAALAGDRPVLTLMCRAIEEGFRALRAQAVGGLPRNLRVLHTPLLRPFAVRYWSRTMRSPVGEQCFAAHSRHARDEMDALAHVVLARLQDRAHLDHLRRLMLAGSSPDPNG
jgi:2-dehydropantoate 2-reductase